MIGMIVVVTVLFVVVVVWGILDPRPMRERQAALIQAHRRRNQSPSPQPTINTRKERRRLNQLAREEWERRWKQETGETWGTIYTTDPAEYTRRRIEHLGGHILDNGMGETVVMWTLGKSGPPVVFGYDPFDPNTPRIASAGEVNAEFARIARMIDDDLEM